MREVRAIPRPAKIPENDFAEAGVARSNLRARRPERITNPGAGALTAHCSDSANEELLLNRQLTTRCATANRERAVVPAKTARKSRLQPSTRLVEGAGSSLEREICQGAESVRIEPVR